MRRLLLAASVFVAGFFSGIVAEYRATERARDRRLRGYIWHRLLPGELEGEFRS